MGKNLAYLVVLIGLSILIVEGIGFVLSGLPGYQHFNRETELVLTDGEQYVLLYDSTLFNVASGEVVSGCYHLTAPSQPGGRGKAELVWPTCRKPGEQ